jgi:hypothetical protein
MSDKKSILESKRIRRSAYVTRARPKKKLKLWIHPSVDMEDYDNQFVLMLSQMLLVAEPLETSTIYHNNFENFYNIHIKSKYDDKVINDDDDEDVKKYKQKKRHYFCATDEMGGVDSGYIIQTANKPNTATIISMDVDEDSDEILEVYALVSFNISNQKMAVHVSTLCGNQVLPPSGEGTRLLKMVEKAAAKISLNKVFLDPVASAINFYGDNKYRVLGPKDSPGTPKSSSSSGSGSSSEEPIQMQKNMKAQKYWNKVRSSYNLGVLLSRSRKSVAEHELRKSQKQIRDSEIASRPPLTGKPIDPIGSSLPGFQRESVQPTTQKKTHKASSHIIVPGATLKRKTRARTKTRTRAKTRTKTRTKTRAKTRAKTRNQASRRHRSLKRHRNKNKA